MAYIGNNPFLEQQKELQYARIQLAGSGAREGDVIPYVMQRRPQWKMYARALGKPYVDWLYDKVARQSGASQQVKAKWDRDKARKKKRGGKAATGLGELAGKAVAGAFKGAAEEFTPDPWYLKAGAAGLVAMIVVGGGVIYYVTRPQK